MTEQDRRKMTGYLCALKNKRSVLGTWAQFVLLATMLCLLNWPASAQLSLEAFQNASIACTQLLRNGTVSLVKNATKFRYSSGCLSEEPQDRCLHPDPGLRCVELPGHNATCVEQIICSEFTFPPNSGRDPGLDWPQFGESLEIRCDEGYEREDGMGFVTRATCTEFGNFSALEDPGFSCVRSKCGIYCRYCGPTADKDPWTKDAKIVTPFYDEFGEQCCKTRPNPIFDEAPDGRNLPVVENGAVLDPLIGVSTGESKTIQCNEGYGPVPGWGFAEPKCIPRGGCVWDRLKFPDPPHWNKECEYVRGKYELGAVCKLIVGQVSFSYSSQPAVECVDTDQECEFPERVLVTLTTLEPEAIIYWSFIGNPVTQATGKSVSVMSGVGQMWEGKAISISSTKSGCNVVTQDRIIRAIAVKDGRPNSILSISPQLKVTATNGAMPANMSKCKDVAPQPKMGCFDPNTPETGIDPAVRSEAGCLAPRVWGAEKPRHMFGGCMAYRFFAFVPIALAGTTADAMALSEFGFRFKGRFVEGAKASTGALYPAAESPRSLTDNNPFSKMLILTNCHVIVDYGRAVAVDQFQIGTSNDCTSRDPVRWLILASNGTGWVVLNEQRRTSFIMPQKRSAFADVQDLPLLEQQVVSAKLFDIKTEEKTKVNNALNEITINITVTDENNKPIAPPMGTTFVVTGLVDPRTPRSQNFLVHSKSVGPEDELNTPAVLPEGSWRNSRLEFLVGSCLQEESLLVKIWLLNPRPSEEPETTNTPREISVSASLPLEAGPKTASTTVLLGGELAKLERFQAFELTRVSGKLNRLSFDFTFNAPPMKGTWLRVRNIVGSMSKSDPKIPITWELENGDLVAGKGNYDAEGGTLSAEMPVDSRYSCFRSGDCQLGKRVTIHFNLYNPRSLQEPLTLVATGDFCPLPARVGCTSETLNEVGPTAGDDDGVLGGIDPCEAPKAEGESESDTEDEPVSLIDFCGVCEGNNTLCQGCDGVPNSGKVHDSCGVCGG
eukprot:CAMPEP_0181290922 /NCGR_PEP_ID=MMETSP1101-20121128/1682_1 /TAXON_ID=46948 /ORGANISM="Rhodomonas abbreviata, Strain Caron Lab Isolate" /LENGTH=1005 /DNA_ID=CAMNT_0023395259 /DNA_START=203 /DNA_END=3217 /DNA_ORIENTATION=-